MIIRMAFNTVITEMNGREEEFNAANANNVSKFECMLMYLMYKTFLKQ